MQHFVAVLGLAAVVMAAPKPEVLRAVKARQVGGGLGGFVPGASGFASGTVPASGVPYGCIGGVVDGEGYTICAREAKQTPAPEIKERQVGGGLGGFVPGASGSLSGDVPAAGMPYGCIGGEEGGEGATYCARNAAPTPAPEIDEALLARQVGGGLGGFVPSASGFLSGTVPADGIPFGCIGGGVIGPDGITICARAAEPTPAPVVERQEGGGLGGFVPNASGFLSGTVPADGVPFGCIGGGVLGPQGVTICAREAEATPAPVVERQIGGGFGGFVPGATGTATGDVPAMGIPTGFIGGSAGGEMLTLFGRQIGGGLGGFVPGATGTLTGDIPANGEPTGFIGGSADGFDTTLFSHAKPTRHHE